MIPVVTPDEMGAIDRAAPEPVDVLIGRAGAAVARAAIDLLGGTYGRRVVVLAGNGNNGNDGREAARRLRARGVRVKEIDALDAPARLPRADLIIDAAFGTGFRGEYHAPVIDDSAIVLAVDIPSGVDGLTGAAGATVWRATRTVTFAALKPGLLLGAGAELAGEVVMADIGLDVSAARAHLVEAADVAGWMGPRPRDAHKWQSAVNVVGGSPGLEGAAALTSRAALRAGAGYVRWSAPGGVPGTVKPLEVVGVDLPATGWASAVLDDQRRFAAMAVGNGLGLDLRHRSDVAALLRGSAVPVVVDADAITLLGDDAAESAKASTIFTPHEGEFERLAGHPPQPDRVADVRALADRLGSVVLLKGPATVVAAPGGAVLIANTGDARLATLGTGDVLSGVIAALCASGVEPLSAAGGAAYLHGLAGVLGWRRGLVAGDLIDNLPKVIDRIAAG
jgi:ADP-dependent NAD(P)H-hydrate dehydratase / NAD(P)H-hydrate epimerase